MKKKTVSLDSRISLRTVWILPWTLCLVNRAGRVVVVVMVMVRGSLAKVGRIVPRLYLVIYLFTIFLMWISSYAQVFYSLGQGSVYSGWTNVPS